LFAEHSLKGLSQLEPVEVVKVTHRRGKIKEPTPSYSKATISQSSSTVDQAASGYVWRHPCQVCPTCVFGGADLKRFDRIVVDEKTWNGDDVFFPRGGTRLMVSERFKALCDNHAIRGAIFKCPEHESYDYYPWETERQREAEQ
jgi:hypothetical protein